MGSIEEIFWTIKTVIVNKFYQWSSSNNNILVNWFRFFLNNIRIITYLFRYYERKRDKKKKT